MNLKYLKKLKVGDEIYHSSFGKMFFHSIDISDNIVYVYASLDEKCRDCRAIYAKNIFTSYEHFLEYNEYCKYSEKKWSRHIDSLKIKDKDLIVCTVYGKSSHEKVLRFYDAKNKCTFTHDGKRSGCIASDIEKYVGEYPEWAKEVQIKLED